MDKLIFLLLIILTVISFPLAKKFIHPGNLVKIASDNKIAYVLPLDEAETVTVKGAAGDSVIEIKNRKVRMKESPCPNKLCVRQGWIESGAIVCVPNRVVVTISNDENNGQYDAVSR
ncbi:MAG: NusG domain II-containing protein [Nitrospirae bacterium]|nr:NusG domain II-containing protein [Nitrospirota bacterium]